MPEVSIYVAIITAAAGVLGAATPQVATLIRDSRQAERDRQERRADAKRQACLELLRAAGDFRTDVANTCHSHGDGMEARLEGVRAAAETVALHAVSVGLLDQKLSTSAERVAAGAEAVAGAAVENFDERVKAVIPEPDYTEFDAAVAAFRRIVMAAARA
jgi:hypothetical protein